MECLYLAKDFFCGLYTLVRNSRAVKISALENREPKAGFAPFVKKRSLFSYQNQIAPISE